MGTGDEDDNDVQLQRASASLLADFKRVLPRLLRRRRNGLVPVALMHKACSLIEPFQEDPQILDPHLSVFIPSLVAAYLKLLHGASPVLPLKDHVPSSYAICYTLNTFCRVRGEKVIKGFFDNEAQYLLPILDELELGRNFRSQDDGTKLHEQVTPWIERYVLLSWLSHLMLVPFPLDSISGLESSEQASTLFGAELPATAPAVTLRVLTICTTLLQSASKERSAAANLLVRLSDGDTPVRYGASKALSVITLELEHEMANEVVDAILSSLNENVYWRGSTRSLSGVDALRWHGLTLTLAQLLYRKAIAIAKLPEVLNALLLSLSFEQRSPTGGSVGTNVRDAACFGIWALSRRYATADLLAVDTVEIRACQLKGSLAVPQALASELLTVACLDPAGNIRRGSSAALQEMVGRHPDTIKHGISLVQIVDFHAVGLRQKAMCLVAPRVGELDPLYWEVLFENLLGWRGAGALDQDSRLLAARATGMLSRTRAPCDVHKLSDRICQEISALRYRQVEERQGLVSALAAVVDNLADRTEKHNEPGRPDDLRTSKTSILHLWHFFESELHQDDKTFTSSALRPELTASSLAVFVATMARVTTQTHESSWPPAMPLEKIVHVLDLCLARQEQSVLNSIKLISPAVISLLLIRDPTLAKVTMRRWMSSLENEGSYNGLRCAGHAVALGSVFSVYHKFCLSNGSPEDKNDLIRIIRILTFRSILLASVDQLEEYLGTQITTALHIALNDYTITERGDVGSIVRMGALETITAGRTAGGLRHLGGGLDLQIYADVLRLSLEKLDKIRAMSARVLRIHRSSPLDDPDNRFEDVSSETYFLHALQIFLSKSSNIVKQAICLGFVSSAGLGSESVSRNARKAFLSFLETLPVDHTAASQMSLADIADCILVLLKDNLNNDRVLLPLLEIIAFLFDMRIMQRLSASKSFNFRNLLSLTQKAHFRSSHVQKLCSALDVYRGLGELSVTSSETFAKLTSMLLHPFPKIRMAAAETLWNLCGVEALKSQDWSLPVKTLKDTVQSIKADLIPGQ
ncbi:hypothetical protein ACEQ8H_008157 [Pleosporales sp. CAS-2024a]